MPNHIPHHYASSATPTHTAHTISSIAPTYAPHLSPIDFWTDPAGVMELLARWRDKLVKGVGSHNNNSNSPNVISSSGRFHHVQAGVVGTSQQKKSLNAANGDRDFAIKRTYTLVTYTNRWRKITTVHGPRGHIATVCTRGTIAAQK